MNIWLVRVFGPEVAKTSVPDQVDIISGHLGGRRAVSASASGAARVELLDRVVCDARVAVLCVQRLASAFRTEAVLGV